MWSSWNKYYAIQITCFLCECDNFVVLDGRGWWSVRPFVRSRNTIFFWLVLLACTNGLDRTEIELAPSLSVLTGRRRRRSTVPTRLDTFVERVCTNLLDYITLVDVWWPLPFWSIWPVWINSGHVCLPIIVIMHSHCIFLGTVWLYKRGMSH